MSTRNLAVAPEHMHRDVIALLCAGLERGLRDRQRHRGRQTLFVEQLCARRRCERTEEADSNETVQQCRHASSPPSIMIATLSGRCGHPAITFSRAHCEAASHMHPLALPARRMWESKSRRRAPPAGQSPWPRREGGRGRWNLLRGRRACCRCCGSWRRCFLSSTEPRSFSRFRAQARLWTRCTLFKACSSSAEGSSC